MLSGNPFQYPISRHMTTHRLATPHPFSLTPLPRSATLFVQHVCKLACSEEVPEPVDMGGEGFCVAFDPLDGSSIVDTNFSVGTIFGVWPGDKLKDITGRDQVGERKGRRGQRCADIGGWAADEGGVTGMALIGCRTRGYRARRKVPG